MKVCIFGDLHGEPLKIPTADVYLLVGDFSEYFDTSDPIWKFYVKALLSRVAKEKANMFKSKKMVKAIQLSIESCIQTLRTFNALEKPIYYVTGNREFFPDFMINYFNLDVPLFSDRTTELDNCICIDLKKINLGDKTLIGISYIPTGFHYKDWCLPEFEEHWENHTREIKRFLQTNKADIILSHNPPLGVLDSHYDNTSLGIDFLREYIFQKTPELFFCGHAHGYHGEEILGTTIVKNLGFRNFEILDF